MSVYENPDWLALVAGIIVDPANDLRRLVAADWLEEQAGVTECGMCKGGPPDEGDAPHPSDAVCPRCQGAGVVPDAVADRAEFIRLQCEAGTATSSREVDLGHANRLDWFDAGAGTRLRIVNESPLELSPTVIGGEWPEFRVRRGFVAEIHAPAAWVWGGPCPTCDETNTACLNCKGTGSTPAHGYAVIRSHPVTRVVVTDAHPHCGRDSWFYWIETGHGYADSSDTVSPEVFKKLDASHPDGTGVMRGFATADSAHAALSAAVIADARSTPNQQEIR